jgi:FlaA1/EpsC-like NDP-sugar epimerase
MDEEADKMRRTEHNKIYVAPPKDIDIARFYDDLQELIATTEEHNDTDVIKGLQKIVPNFHPNRDMMKEQGA